MRMTMEEAMSCPKGMSMEEWSKELARIKRLRRKLAKLIDERCFLEDALDVLEDEAGSERWNRKRQELEEVKAKIEKVWNQM